MIRRRVILGVLCLFCSSLVGCGKKPEVTDFQGCFYFLGSSEEINLVVEMHTPQRKAAYISNMDELHETVKEYLVEDVSKIEILQSENRCKSEAYPLDFAEVVSLPIKSDEMDTVRKILEKFDFEITYNNLDTCSLTRFTSKLKYAD